MNASAPDNRAAFTLVELMVAIALMSIFVLMVATIFTQAQGAFSRGRANVLMAQEARAILDILAQDFRSATLVTYYDSTGATTGSQTGDFFARQGYPDPDDRNFSASASRPVPGPDPRVTSTDMTSPPQKSWDDLWQYLPRIYFVTNLQQPGSASSAQSEAEPYQVSYRLVYTRRDKARADPDTAGSRYVRGVYRLERRTLKVHEDTFRLDPPSYVLRDLVIYDPDETAAEQRPVDLSVSRLRNADYPPNNNANERNDVAGTTHYYDIKAEPIGFNVLWIEYRFLRADTREFLEEEGDWDDTSALPLVVQVSLTLTDPDRRQEATYTARFYIPAAEQP